MKEYGEKDLAALIAAVREGTNGEQTLYLLANTSGLAEGWRERVARFELGAEPGSPLEAVARDAARSLGLPLVWETPLEVIPLPPNWENRSRPAAAFEQAGHPLRVLHFDPYSIVLRLVARGDEPDYLASLEYLRRGWVEVTVLESLLGDLLPRFTSATLAQDPAEFRRKFRGLRQLSASLA